MDTRIKLIAEDYTKDGVLAIEKLSELTKALIYNTDQLRIANERKANAEKKEVQETIGIINNLNEKIKETTRLRNESTDISKISQYNKELSKQEAELKKLTDTQQKSNVLTKEQNEQIQSLTGNTEKSNGMFKNLAATMLGLFAVDRIIDYSKQMFELVINSDRMNIALKNVTQSNAEYHQSLGFLNKLSNDYGQNVNTLKESYVSFLASSKSTNLSVKERQGIYESIIKAGSALTLSNDAIEGSLRAVSQMFSKGNVSAEELRGQLGERLPGAFGIMAEALGVNEKKLNKMLEQGEVLAEEALPKFAKALEEAYGDKAKSNIDTVTGASNRFGRSLTENLTKINENTGFTKALANGINFLADNFKTLVNVIIGAGAALAAYTLKQVFSNSVAKIQLINLGQEVLAKQAASVATLELTAAETAAAAAATRFNAAMAAAPHGAALIALSALVTMILQHNDAQQRAYELTEAGIKATDEEIKGERAHAVELGITIEQTKKLAYGTEERLTNVKKLMQQYPQYFKDMTAEQVSNWHLTNAYRGVNAEIERKITLLAREKSVQGLTNRAAEIKAELEQLGVFTTNMNEYNKQTETFKNSFKDIRGKILEYNQVMLNLDKTTLRLTDSQKQMFNQEAQNNKAKLQAGLISEKEFKAEVMRIQEVYGIKVQNYKVEETLLGKSVDNNKKANDKKAKEEKEFNKQMAAEKAAFQQKISDIDNRGEEERAFEREKQVKKIYPIYSSSYDKVKQASDNLNKETKETGEKYSQQLTDRISKDSENIKKIIEETNAFFAMVKKEAEMAAEIDKLWETTMEETEKQMKKKQQNFEMMFEDSLRAVSDVIDQVYEYFDKKSKDGETAAERQGAALNKAFLDPFKENVNAAKALMSGDFLGAAKGLAGYFEGLWKTTIGLKKTLNEIRLNEFNIQWESTMSNLESYSDAIKENFEGLADASIQFNTTQKTGVDALIQAEIDRAGKIKETYTLALSKEDELYNKKIKSINDEYDASIAAINKKYDYISVKANQQFDSDSLAITEGVNNQLMGFVSGQELQLGLTTQYETKKNEIRSKFAHLIKPIVEGMSQAEIDGINAATKAQDAAFAQLAVWQTGQIQFVIDNGKLERDTFTDTQKIIADGKDAQYQLGLKFQSQEIANNLAKNTEIEAAEKTRNLNIEAESLRHNNELIRLGTEKDTALLNSFNALKDAMKNGYAEILQSASDAYTKGLITAQEYLDKLKEIQALRGLVGESTPSLTNDIRDRLRNLGIPGFKTGTEMVGGIKGVDKNLAWLSNDEAVLQGDLNKKRLDKGINRFEMVEYAINYKSILDGGFQPLQIKTSALDKLEEHKAMQYLINMNVGEIVSELQGVKSALKSIPIQNFTLDENGLSKYVETKNNVTKFKAKRLK